MLRRALIVGLILGLAAFPASCSTKNDNSGTAGGSGGQAELDPTTGTNSEGGSNSQTDLLSQCPAFRGLETCSSSSLKATPVEVSILLLLDTSGSMDHALADDSTASLWNATRLAVTDALTTAQSSINFGLDFFPNAGSLKLATSCEMPDQSELVVPIAQGAENRTLIVDAIGKKGPGGGTPTQAALRRAFDYFSTGAGADLGGSRFVLLATDGGPNCNDGISCGIETCTANIDAKPDDKLCSGTTNCCDGFALGCLDDAGTLSAISALNGLGVDTFVIGLPGSELYDEQLNKFAIQGGRPLIGGTEKYFKVSAEGATDGLADVLRTITQKLITSCKVEMTAVPMSISKVNVAVDCEVVPMAEGKTTSEANGGQGGSTAQSSSAANSWYYDALTNSAILQGPICDKIETEGVKSVDIIEGCPTLR